MTRAPTPIRRVLLVTPPTGLYRRDDRCQCTVEDQTVQIVFPPIDLALAAACAERAGATCLVEDYPATGRGWDAFRDDVRRFVPDLLVFSSTTATLEADVQSARLAKEIVPTVLTAGKGETLVFDAPRVLRAYPALDVILPNEPEGAIEELVAGRPLPAILGLHHRTALLERLGVSEAPQGIRSHRKAHVAVRRASARHAAAMADAMPATDEDLDVRFTGMRPLETDLDRYPLPARHLLDNDRYRSPETGAPLTVIHASRGCPAACVYCPAGTLTDFTVRLRSVAHVVHEIETCVGRYGIREFLFHGDTFTVNRRWVLDLCAAIVHAGLDVRWGCNSRVDTIDDELAAAMRAAGAWVVGFGVESGDQTLLDRMKKNATLDHARTAVSICKRHGLRTHTFFVIGLPWETPETLRATYRFARELDPDFFDFNIATPLPGTELWELAVRGELFERGYDAARAGYAAGSLRTFGGLSSDDLMQWRRRALLSMYLRPRYVGRTLWQAGSPRVAANYVRAASRRLHQLLRAS